MIKKIQRKKDFHRKKESEASILNKTSIQQYAHRYNLYLKEQQVLRNLSANRHQWLKLIQCIEKTISNLWNRIIHPKIRGHVNQKELFTNNVNENIDMFNQTEKQKLKKLIDIVSEEPISEQLTMKRRVICIAFKGKDMKNVLKLFSDKLITNLQDNLSQWPISVIIIEQHLLNAGKNTSLLETYLNQFRESIKKSERQLRPELSDITNIQQKKFFKQQNKAIRESSQANQLDYDRLSIIPLTLGLLDQICIHPPLTLKYDDCFEQMNKILKEQTSLELLIKEKSKQLLSNNHKKDSDMQSSHKIYLQRDTQV